MLALGAGPGIPVAIMCSTRPEWALFDMANLCIGSITVGLYPNVDRSQVRQLLAVAGPRIVVVEDRAKRLLIQEATHDFDVRPIVVTFESGTDVANAPAVTLVELSRLGRRRRETNPDEFERRVDERRPDEIVSYVFTAGTTGAPKAAMLSHRNFYYVIQATNALVPYGSERALVNLPMTHSLQRYVNYLNLMVDVELHYGGPLSRIESDLREVKPTCFAAVPQILERLQRRVVAKAHRRDRVQRAGFNLAVAAMSAKANQLRAGYEPGVRGRIEARLADRVVGRRIRDQLGGQVKFVGAGGGPLSADVHAFFEDVGVPVLAGYGLTETCAPACLNTLDNRRIGTAGRPLPGTEVRVEKDGEILVRGPGVFQGYHRDSAATEAAFTADGWFKTGDVGAISRDGFLTVTDRMEDLITTADGATVAPQPIELALRRHPWVEQAVVVGHDRPYLAALVSLDPEALPDVADRIGLARIADPEELASHPLVREVLEAHFSTVNAEQPEEQQVRRFSVVPDPFSASSGELTPTHKVRRQFVIERRRAAIDRLYRS